MRLRMCLSAKPYQITNDYDTIQADFTQKFCPN